MEQKSGQGKSLWEKLFPQKVLLILSILLIVAVGGVMASQKMGENPAFCGNCHIIQPYYESWDNSKLLANQHKDAGIKCTDCHSSTIVSKAEEGLKYVTGNYETPMKKRELPKEMCLKCHNMEKVTAKTNFEEDHSNPHESHQGEQECNKCHNMHQESNVMCSQCHAFEWMDKLPPSFKKGAY